MDEIKISKKAIYILIIVILILTSGALFFINGNKSAGVEEYKKEIYESVSCQYNCPVKEYDLAERKEYLLDDSCVKECIAELKAKGFVKDQFSAEELTTDDFAFEIDEILQGCRQEFVDEENLPDNLGFYGCVKEKLASMKEKYSYL